MTDHREMDNRTLLQTFEWHTPSTPTHWVHLTRLLPQFAQLGITSIWLPPGCKADYPNGNGYDVYDLWDLGEFDQKRSRATKWGSRQELDQLLRTAHECGIDVIWDAVINHKQSGDRTESNIWAVEVDPEDRRYEISSPKQIEAWLRYDFPGREKEGMKYSKMKWHAAHFNATDWDQSRRKNAIYKLIDDPSTRTPFKQPKRQSSLSLASPRTRLSTLRSRLNKSPGKPAPPAAAPPARRPGKGWAEDVDDDKGNNDYLLFSNIDYTHLEVREDVMNWGAWMVNDIGIQGFRLDAVQHFSYNYTRDWIQHVNAVKKQKDGEDVFVVGEIWCGQVERILKWLDVVQLPRGPQVYAYDSPLLYNFSRISEDVRTRSKNVDLRTILRESLLQHRPEAAVTVVTNHDTQPGQTCATPMYPRLKALWYAFILLSQHGYPCIFWGDLFGTHGPEAEPPACLVEDSKAKGEKKSLLPDLILCRKLFAYGEQNLYINGSTCLGWTRAGSKGKAGCAVVLNVSPTAIVGAMSSCRPGDVMVDVLGQVKEEVKIDNNGSGRFRCEGLGVSVFVTKTAKGVTDFPVNFDLQIY